MGTGLVADRRPPLRLIGLLAATTPPKAWVAFDTSTFASAYKRLGAQLANPQLSDLGPTSSRGALSVISLGAAQR